MDRKTNKWVLDKIGSVFNFMLRKSMAERKMRFFGQIVRSIEKKIDTYRERGKANGEGADLQRSGSRI